MMKDRIEHDEDRALEALFRHARARPRAPAGVEQRIRAGLHSEWARLTSRRARRYRVGAWAFAASLVMAVLLLINYPRPDTAVTQQRLAAAVEKTSGEVFVRDADGSLTGLNNAAQLLTGLDLFTGQDSGIALRWSSGESLRLHQNSHIRLLSENEIEIFSGRLYVDSGRAGGAGHGLGIQTPAGLVRHLGTQYMIGVSDTGTGISVREGKVAITTGHDRAVTGRGRHTFFYSDGRKRVADIDTFGDAWQWTEQLVPQFNMDGRTMHDFLAWVGHETGRRVTYASVAAKDMAAQAQMHGHADLAPLRALDVLLPTSDLVYRLQEDTIIIFTREEA